MECRKERGRPGFGSLTDETLEALEKCAKEHGTYDEEAGREIRSMLGLGPKSAEGEARKALDEALRRFGSKASQARAARDAEAADSAVHAEVMVSLALGKLLPPGYGEEAAERTSSSAVPFVYDDGGRSKYFRARNVGDCVARAICNATGKDYKEVYDALNALAKKERTGKRKRGISNARKGVYKATERKYLESIGWAYRPTMSIGSGCNVHLDPRELPKGVLIVQVSKHVTCMRYGVMYDTYDCSRNGTRCVYGYYYPCTDEAKAEAEAAKGAL